MNCSTLSASTVRDYRCRRPQLGVRAWDKKVYLQPAFRTADFDRVFLAVVATSLETLNKTMFEQIATTQSSLQCCPRFNRFVQLYL